MTSDLQIFLPKGETIFFPHSAPLSYARSMLAYFKAVKLGTAEGEQFMPWPDYNGGFLLHVVGKDLSFRHDLEKESHTVSYDVFKENTLSWIEEAVIVFSLFSQNTINSVLSYVEPSNGPSSHSGLRSRLVDRFGEVAIRTSTSSYNETEVAISKQ